jgi:hypothetical protein
MSIQNEFDKKRASVFWVVWIIGSLALVLSVYCFMVVGVEIRTQLIVFIVISVTLLIAFFIGRWEVEPREEEDFAERWRIGPWIITFMLLELAFCGAVICYQVWAIVTHNIPPLGAM